MEYAIIGIVVVLLGVFWGISTRNGFQEKELRVQESLSGIEVALTKRYDLLTKLLDTTKGYMTHEKDLLSNVIRLRQGMSMGEMNQAQAQLDALSAKVFAVVENYPQLRSSEIFAELQRGIRDAEEHLQAARRLHNGNVKRYNTAISLFPGSLLAKGRRPYEFFEAEAHKREDVTMKF